MEEKPVYSVKNVSRSGGRVAARAALPKQQALGVFKAALNELISSGFAVSIHSNSGYATINIEGLGVVCDDAGVPYNFEVQDA